MSLVVFPFKEEALDVVEANLEVAAAHARVSEVWAVAADDGRVMGQVETIARGVAARHSKPVRVFAQERLGSYRSGKGDGLNTALARSAAEGWDRVHFYDADITNFDSGWIDGAERAADRGHDMVRHRFPRASTDAMITWMVTRPALAMLFPGTLLPRLGQPLGGEVLLTGEVVDSLATDPSVISRSDWGIDTLITYATTGMARSIYEHNVESGKRHALYGSLAEIRVMMLECLDAVRSLRDRHGPTASFTTDSPTMVPDDLKRTVGYDLESTVGLLTEQWDEGEIELARELPFDLGDEMLENLVGPNYSFMDEEAWGHALGHLLEHFTLGDPAWEGLAFRLWIARVLGYTTQHAARGYDHAIAYLEGTIRDYEARADQDGRR